MSSLIKAVQSPTEMREIASRICREYLSGAWKNISAEDIQLKRISGGLSNFLYYVSLPDVSSSENNNSTGDHVSKVAKLSVNGHTTAKRLRKDSYQTMLEPKEVLLRVYGQTHGEHALETMLTESVVFTLLSERKLGPKLHGIFPGGRIEQYIPARALTTNELSDPKISLKIAEKMSEIHSLDIPVCKAPEWLWNTMNRWLKNVESVLATAGADNLKNGNEVEEQMVLNKIDFRKEVEWLRKTIEREEMPVVFSHNDLQEGNILLREDYLSDSASEHYGSNDSLENYNGLSGSTNGHSRKRSIVNDDSIEDFDNTRDSVLSGNSSHLTDGEPELMIIDFEYCAYNYRGFDLANHFSEWTFDYTNEKFPYFYHRKDQYPSEEQKEQFIRMYLAKSKMVDDDAEVTQQEIDMLSKEIDHFTLATQLFWAMWSIVNVHQEIEFGYWQHGACRVNEYLLEKEKFLKMYPQNEPTNITSREK